MEPPIQYCTTADGVSIAYWSIGQGDAIIDAGQPPTHIQMEWRLAPIRAWYERFARRHQFIRFDTRGTGLSDRDVDAYSLDTMISDLEAVADAVPLDHFTLIGSINSAPPAIAYAARHPERVSKATRALECAVAMQHTFARRNASAAHSIRVRIGVNAGEPIAEEGDLFGIAVTMAAWIMGQARGGEILLSDVVRQLVAGKGYRFEDRGESTLRGFDHPVRIYELRLPPEARTESL